MSIKNLTTGIYGKASGSDFLNAVSGRFFKGRAPQNTDYPYCVYNIVSTSPEKTYNEVFENTIVSFSIFSEASGSTEIEDIYTYLNALYDECTLTITGWTLIWMKRTNASLLPEEHNTPNGVIDVWHYAIDFEIKMQD